VWALALDELVGDVMRCGEADVRCYAGAGAVGMLGGRAVVLAWWQARISNAFSRLPRARAVLRRDALWRIAIRWASRVGLATVGCGRISRGTHLTGGAPRLT